MNEEQRLHVLGADDEPAAGDGIPVVLHLSSTGSIEEVVRRSGAVILALIRLKDWNDDVIAAAQLPDWLRRAFPARDPEGNLWHACEDWVYWMHPDRRQWRWWSATWTTSTGVITILVEGWPAMVESFELLLILAGASSITRDGTERVANPLNSPHRG